MVRLSSVIDDVMRQLSFDETELDGEAGFADVTGSGMDSSGLSHDESFGVSELPVSEEPDVGPTQEPILAEVRTQEPIMAEEFSVEDVVIEDYVSSGEVGEDAEQGNGQEDESAPTDGQFFYDDEGIYTAYETEYDVQSSKDAGTDDDDDDVDEDFLVDKENEIVEPDVDVHLFGEDVDVINADSFDSDPGNDEERNYRKRRLAELRTKMKGVINASGFRASRRDLLGLDGAFMKGPFLGQCLGDDIDLHPNSNFTFISDRQKGIIPTIKTVYPSAEHRYCLRHIHENMKQGLCVQAYKDLFRRAASATNVRDFEKYCCIALKATCKGQGRKATTGGNNAEGSGSASRQAQQTEPAVGQDGSGGSGTGVVIGLSVAAGKGGAGKGGAGVANQVSQTRNADGREMGDSVPTQSNAAGGASEWSFL
ncbi:mutator type transposase [Tanacetum coccineum]|uniref:Mutator type transposase n=1 Tax=Tanacetum coccineum TaxID=301880 RepID=A0ABQ5CDV4_9ASTR